MVNALRELCLADSIQVNKMPLVVFVYDTEIERSARNADDFFFSGGYSKLFYIKVSSLVIKPERMGRGDYSHIIPLQIIFLPIHSFINY